MMASRPRNLSRPTSPLHELLGQEGGAESPHHPEMLRDDDLLAKPLFQGGPDAYVGGHSPLEKDQGFDLLSPGHVGQVVADQRLTKPCDRIFLAVAQLLLVGSDPTRRILHSAPRFLRDCGRAGHSPQILLMGIPRRLVMVQERSGSWGADGVHVKPDANPVPDDDELRILTTDVDDRLHPGFNMGRQLLRGR